MEHVKLTKLKFYRFKVEQAPGHYLSHRRVLLGRGVLPGNVGVEQCVRKQKGVEDGGVLGSKGETERIDPAQIAVSSASKRAACFSASEAAIFGSGSIEDLPNSELSPADIVQRQTPRRERYRYPQRWLGTNTQRPRRVSIMSAAETTAPPIAAILTARTGSSLMYSVALDLAASMRELTSRAVLPAASTAVLAYAWSCQLLFAGLLDSSKSLDRRLLRLLSGLGWRFVVGIVCFHGIILRTFVGG